MGWIQRNWTLFSITVLSVAAGWIAFTSPPVSTATGSIISAPAQGFLAPDFSLESNAVQGKIRLSDLRGSPVLVNLWASWCGPCRSEMPSMQKVYEAYAPQGLEILAINTTYQDDPALALDFARELGLTFPILFDASGEVSRIYKVRAMPTSFFIDRSGIVRRVVIGGPMSESLMRAEIERLLEGNP